MNCRILLLAVSCLTFGLVGCFTVNETVRPVVSMPAASAETNVTVSVRGFGATLTDYVLVDGYETYYSPCGRYGYGPCGGYRTAYASMSIPRQSATDMFLDQAKGRFEDAGYAIMAQQPDYVVEVRFTGPSVSGSDSAASLAWMLCTIFTCDHAAQSWQARLKVYDNRTGKLLHTETFSQRYEVTGFSPIPLVGMSFYDRTAPRYMQCWCLGLLTDRACAGAIGYLRGLDGR